MKRNDGSSANDGINNSTYNLLFNDYDNVPDDDIETIENYIAYVTIDKFTKLRDNKLIIKLFKLISKKSIINLNKINFNEKTKEYEYINNNMVITFDKLSNYINDKSLVKELTSNKRYHKCHSRSIIFSPKINGSKILTGYITVGGQRVLHSVIEYKYDNDDIILDWTRNLKITKNQYIKLTKFSELSAFDGENVSEDIQILTKYLNIGLKTYLTFRNELINEIRKKAVFFNATENKKKLLLKKSNN